MTLPEHGNSIPTSSAGRSSTSRSATSPVRQATSSSSTSNPHSCLEESVVIDSRLRTDRNSIRRRRICPRCKERFTTTEILTETILTENDQNSHKRKMIRTVEKFETELAKLRRMVEKL
jgi:hypothetical protein